MPKCGECENFEPKEPRSGIWRFVGCSLEILDEDGGYLGAVYHPYTVSHDLKVLIESLK